MYDYERERKAIFTEEGQVAFLEIRDRVQAAIEAFRGVNGDSFFHLACRGDNFFHLACLDRLVELGELVKVRSGGSCWAQYQVYTTPQVRGL